jgi:hypothetical protein
MKSEGFPMIYGPDTPRKRLEKTDSFPRQLREKPAN